MEAECDGSEVVIRFSPFLAHRLEENAQDTFDDDQDRGVNPPRYGVSVIAGYCEDGEDLEATITRLTKQTTLRGKRIAVVTGTMLRREGFDLVKDPTTKEPLHHLVGEDPFSAPPRVDVLASLLDDNRTGNPAWMEGAA
ncbi:hypothetical protein RWH43_00835 [Microbacterium sp. KSW2-21]|uniref:Uncharacterized protein n=1 Tax=Microbacterium algihabitans TaxID=3075992 RepID=A0ABU3RR66_9MICO|nr:hypothetical protein [Microbacterium sp. KSW2-21]MDU0325289.1 hypothetical protein [Microbacterium sp. KSW2-21]